MTTQSCKGGWRYGAAVNGRDVKAEGWSLCLKDRAADRRHRHKRLRAEGKRIVRSESL